ncbi:hypothetical protein ES288_D04G084300v1, partial [Gossypium darwinii]
LFRSALFFPFSKFCPPSSSPSSAIKLSTQFLPSNSLAIFQIFSFIFSHKFVTFSPSVPIFQHFYSLSSPSNADSLFKKINFTPLNFSPKKCSDSASPTTTPFLPSTSCFFPLSKNFLFFANTGKRLLLDCLFSSFSIYPNFVI